MKSKKSRGKGKQAGKRRIKDLSASDAKAKNAKGGVGGAFASAAVSGAAGGAGGGIVRTIDAFGKALTKLGQG